MDICGEIGETAIQLPLLSEINNELNALVNSTVHMKLEEILIKISECEQIPRERLLNKYLPEVETSKTPRKQLDTDIRCNARTAAGARCSRKQKNGKFCGSHVNTPPSKEYTTQPTIQTTQPIIQTTQPTIQTTQTTQTTHSNQRPTIQAKN